MLSHISWLPAPADSGHESMQCAHFLEPSYQGSNFLTTLPRFMLCALWMELGFCSCAFLLTKRLWPIVTTLTRSVLCVQWKYTSRRLWHFNIFPTMRILGKHWQYSQDVCCGCSFNGALPTGGSALSTFSCTKGAVAYTDTFDKIYAMCSFHGAPLPEGSVWKASRACPQVPPAWHHLQVSQLPSLFHILFGSRAP